MYYMQRQQATAARFLQAFLAHGFSRISYLEVRSMPWIYVYVWNNTDRVPFHFR